MKVILYYYYTTTNNNNNKIIISMARKFRKVKFSWELIR